MGASPDEGASSDEGDEGNDLDLQQQFLLAYGSADGDAEAEANSEVLAVSAPDSADGNAGAVLAPGDADMCAQPSQAEVAARLRSIALAAADSPLRQPAARLAAADLVAEEPLALEESAPSSSPDSAAAVFGTSLPLSPGPGAEQAESAPKSAPAVASDAPATGLLLSRGATLAIPEHQPCEASQAPALEAVASGLPLPANAAVAPPGMATAAAPAAAAAEETVGEDVPIEDEDHGEETPVGSDTEPESCDECVATESGSDSVSQGTVDGEGVEEPAPGSPDFMTQVLPVDAMPPPKVKRPPPASPVTSVQRKLEQILIAVCKKGGYSYGSLVNRCYVLLPPV